MRNIALIKKLKKTCIIYTISMQLKLCVQIKGRAKVYTFIVKEIVFEVLSI